MIIKKIRIFAHELNGEMDVYMDDDLFELYSTGKNRKYK